jgi:DmsE family decaheme c-type cytochrome
MRGTGMNVRNTSTFLLFTLLLLFVLSPALSQDKFNLKQGARGKLCLNCHQDFREKLKNPFVHTPVKSGDCSECHNPHSASHGKLLSAEPDKICYKCHDAVIPEEARSIHKVVAEGNCSKCHDPHGAANKHNLVKAGKDLCFDCHGDLGNQIRQLKIKHKPVEDNCLNCHDSHASSKHASLLKKDEGSLCKECHNTARLAFVKQHNNYPIAEARCTSCHNPHGSNVAGMLFDNVHEPLARRMCTQCHESPESPTPLKTKKEGFELCRGCHYEVVNETFSKNRSHWPIFSEEGCLSCHSPHASNQAALLKDINIKLCGSCHDDTIKRQTTSETKHEPVSNGECTVCHSPHASDNLFLMSESSIIDLCGSCHDWQKHSTHPVGEEVIDMRNSNLTVQCLSCHRSHGTENKHMMPFATITDTCVQCHVKFKR